MRLAFDFGQNWAAFSEARLDAERRQTYLDRLTNRLTQIQGMLNTRRYKRRDYTWAQIEKARGGNPAKRLVEVELTGEEGHLKLTSGLNQEKLQHCWSTPSICFLTI